MREVSEGPGDWRDCHLLSMQCASDVLTYIQEPVRALAEEDLTQI